MDHERRERILARISDLLRRGGTADAEQLVAELESELGAPIFTKDGDTVFVFRAEIPAGAFLTERMFRARWSASFLTDGLFPHYYRTTEAHVGVFGCDDAVRDQLVVTERYNGIEMARHPLKAFSGRRAVNYQREYDPNGVYDFDVGLLAPTPATLVRPWSIALQLHGWRNRT